MPRFCPRPSLVAGIAIALAGSGCSLILSTSNATQPCATDDACLPGFACSDGLCRPNGAPDSGGACVAPGVSCGDAGHCTALASDAQNCGACGLACARGDVCQNGLCVFDCPNPNTICVTTSDAGVARTCVDLQSDSNNCNSCGAACGPLLGCSAGDCIACGNAGQSCCGTQCNGALTCQAGLCAALHASIAVGALHTCVLDDGGVLCFGDGANGQLGDGLTTDTPTPTAVQGLTTPLVRIAAGVYETCGVDSAGAAWCWGTLAASVNQGVPALGAPRLTATALAAPGPLQRISVGYTHDCATSPDGALYCWGAESEGELGNGAASGSVPTPALVNLGVTAAAVTAGLASTCVLVTGGLVECFGRGTNGELGQTSADALTAIQVPIDGGADLDRGDQGDLYCILQAGGTVACWGQQEACQENGVSCVPSNAVVSVPTMVALPEAVLQISSAQTHACALGQSGAVYCFGDNVYGELGDGSTAFSAQVTAQVPEPAVDVQVGFTHSCARGRSGTVYCWGSNSHGQLGQSGLTGSALPLAVP